MSDMGRQAIFPLVDRIIGGDLADRLLQARTEGQTLRQLVMWLHDEHQIEVTDTTISRWYEAIDRDREVRAAS